MKRNARVTTLATTLVWLSIMSTGPGVVLQAHAESSQAISDFSFGSSGKLLEKLESASNTSVAFSAKADQKLRNIRDALKKEATQEIRKDSFLNTTYGSSLAVGAFSVASVEVVVRGAHKITKAVVKGAQTGSEYTLEVSEKYVGNPSAKAMDSIASRIFKVGKGIVVGSTQSGTILIKGSIASGEASLQGESEQSSNILVGSIRNAAGAFGSRIVEGFKN